MIRMKKIFMFLIAAVSVGCALQPDRSDCPNKVETRFDYSFADGSVDGLMGDIRLYVFDERGELVDVLRNASGMRLPAGEFTIVAWASSCGNLENCYTAECSGLGDFRLRVNDPTSFSDLYHAIVHGVHNGDHVGLDFTRYTSTVRVKVTDEEPVGRASSEAGRTPPPHSGGRQISSSPLLGGALPSVAEIDLDACELLARGQAFEENPEQPAAAPLRRAATARCLSCPPPAADFPTSALAAPENDKAALAELTTRGAPPDIYIKGRKGTYLHDGCVCQDSPEHRYDHTDGNIHIQRLDVNFHEENPVTLHVESGNEELIEPLDLLQTILKNPKYRTQKDLDAEDVFDIEVRLKSTDVGLSVTILVDGFVVMEVEPGEVIITPV